MNKKKRLKETCCVAYFFHRCSACGCGSTVTLAQQQQFFFVFFSSALYKGAHLFTAIVRFCVYMYKEKAANYVKCIPGAVLASKCWQKRPAVPRSRGENMNSWLYFGLLNFKNWPILVVGFFFWQDIHFDFLIFGCCSILRFGFERQIEAD